MITASGLVFLGFLCVLTCKQPPLLPFFYPTLFFPPMLDVPLS